jgi:hypothetical protein
VNYRTSMLVFTVATSLVEMNSTARLSPPAFIRVRSAAKTVHSILSFEMWMPLRPALAGLLPAIQQASDLP